MLSKKTGAATMDEVTTLTSISVSCLYQPSLPRSRRKTPLSRFKDKKRQRRKQEKERQDRSRNWEKTKKNAAPLHTQHEFFQKMINMTKYNDSTRDAI